MNIRALTATLLQEIIVNHQSLSYVLETLETQKEKPLIQALCYGVCRYYYQLDFIANQFLAKPLRDKDSDIYILILLGLYQILYTRIPDFAAVKETAEAAKTLKKPWGVKLINGLLRNFLRKQPAIAEMIKNNDIAFYSHPHWMIEKIQQQYPQQWQQILLRNNEHPPLSLRVNVRKLRREKYLENYNLTATIFPYNDCGLTLEKPLSVEEIPGFFQGEVSVQDTAAQLATPLLELKPQLCILDACAAPGGKTAHILESEPNLKKLLALEIDSTRANKIKENLQRLNLIAEVKIADANQPETYWDQQPFDRILLDAPCSATGVIRRHPDIKLLRNESDIPALAEQQTQLLNTLWALLRPGGLMIYATCSIFSEENSFIIEKFLMQHSDAQEKIISMEFGSQQKYGRQILPGELNMDGFYYCCLQKKSSSF